MIQYEKVTGDFDLSGKSAIVVGGAGGIGEATARMYAKKGANVAIVDCRRIPVRQWQKQLQASSASKPLVSNAT